MEESVIQGGSSPLYEEESVYRGDFERRHCLPGGRGRDRIILIFFFSIRGVRKQDIEKHSKM